MDPAELGNRQDVANRIRSLREDNDFTIDEMAIATGRSAEEYAARESGDMDLTFTFVYKCAKKLGVDVVELLTGESPRLKHYEIVRAGDVESLAQAMARVEASVSKPPVGGDVSYWGVGPWSERMM